MDECCLGAGVNPFDKSFCSIFDPARLTLAASRSTRLLARLLSQSEIDTSGSSSCASHAPLARLFNRELLRDCGEEFLDVLGGLSGGLEEEKVGLAGVGFGVGGRDGALVWLFCNKIGLVSCKCDDDVLVGLSL